MPTTRSQAKKGNQASPASKSQSPFIPGAYPKSQQNVARNADRLQAQKTSARPTVTGPSSIITARRKRTQRQRHVVRINGDDNKYVFVGNLVAGVTEPELNHLFSPCGKISRIELRLCQGQGVTAGMPIPAAIKRDADIIHARVDFEDSASVSQALKLRGREIYGRPIVVTLTVFELPECQNFIRTAEQHPVNDSDRRLVLQFTEEALDIIIPEEDSPEQRLGDQATIH